MPCMAYMVELRKLWFPYGLTQLIILVHGTAVLLHSETLTHGFFQLNLHLMWVRVSVLYRNGSIGKVCIAKSHLIYSLYCLASEYQYFLLYYLVPCMENILETKYFDHVIKLVTACYLLNKDSISINDLMESARLINEFHSEFIQFYGMIYMHYDSLFYFASI